jgi:hypothetical protein
VLKVYTDFNEQAENDDSWLLLYRERELADQITELRLAKGDKVLLYQDEDDFEVTAVLDYRYVDMLERPAWVATPDWSTLVRK